MIFFNPQKYAEEEVAHWPIELLIMKHLSKPSPVLSLFKENVSSQDNDLTFYTIQYNTIMLI